MREVPRLHWLKFSLLVPLIGLGAAGCTRQETPIKQMSRPTNPVSDSTVRFHRIVEQNDLKELEAALKSGTDINAPGHIGLTALMLAIAAKDLEKTMLLIRYGADPELTDDFNRTALGHAVEDDFEDGVRFLLSLGVDRGFKPKYPLKKIAYDMALPEVPMPEPLRIERDITDFRLENRKGHH
jgi:ankyrin repeat protein